MIEEPMIKAKPVPTAKTGGTPNTSNPPVIKNPPPTPKKPLRVPTMTPSSKRSAGLTATSAFGNHISVVDLGVLTWLAA
jgi:hypothetical protein